MQTLDLADDTATLAPLSYSEEAAWHEFRTNPQSFFLRGLTLVVPMPAGAERAHAERVVAALVARHEVFRTAFETVDGAPRRRVYRAYHHDIVEADAPVYGIPSPDPENLRPDDVFRAWLTPNPEGGTRLSVDLNEMITDSWSCARLNSELADLVETCAAGRDPSPVSAEVAYSTFATEQRDQPLPEKLTEYWRKALSGMEAPAYLAVDGPDSSGEPVGERVWVFHDDLTAAVKSICSQHRLSRFMAAVAILNTTLASRSGARDITLCTATGTRGARFTEVHGNFSNLVLLRTVLAENPSFAELAAATRATVLGALAHQEMPFLRLCQVVDGDVTAPPVRVHFLPHRMHHYKILDGKQSGDFWAEEAMFSTWPAEVGFAEDSSARIACWLNYDATRYTHANMERVIRDFGQVLRAVATNPLVTCADLIPFLEAV